MERSPLRVAIGIARSARPVARKRWIQARRRELLPSPYVHVVFTLPRQLASLALQNKKLIYGLLLRASAETLLEVARNPRRLGAEIGFFSVLHTWNQKLQLHPHVHCIVPAGGLSLDHARWIHSRSRFFLSIHVLRRVFRGKFVAGLQSAFQHGQLHLSGDLAGLAPPKIFASWLRLLFRKDWVVYSKPPFGGPNMCFSISAATPIAWPSPTIAWSRSPTDRSRSVGAIPLTTTSKN